MTDRPGTLDAFFREIRPLLLGETDAGTFLARVGPSPSTERRVGLYARLVEHDLTSGMDALYPAVRVAAERLDGPPWRALLADYFRAHPPAHWDLNRCGEALPRWLSARRAADPSCPILLEELAELQWTEYLVYTSPAVMPPRGLNPTAELRQFTHAVSPWASAARHGDASGLPEARPTTLVVYRDPISQLTRTLEADGAMLLVLATEQGASSAPVQAAVALLGPAGLAQVRARLVKAGVVLDPDAA